MLKMDFAWKHARSAPRGCFIQATKEMPRTQYKNMFAPREKDPQVPYGIFGVTFNRPGHKCFFYVFEGGTTEEEARAQVQVLSDALDIAIGNAS